MYNNEMKIHYSLEGLNSIFQQAKERICEHKDRPLEKIKSEEQNERMMKS